MMREDYSSPHQNCRPRAALRCGLSFTIRALTATRNLAAGSIGNLTANVSYGWPCGRVNNRRASGWA